MKRLRVFLVVLAALPWVPAPHPALAQAELSEAIVLTEAAGEPYEVKVGVAEVLRNRGWNSKGFCGLHRADLPEFLSRQPAWAKHQARQALAQARLGSNLTGRATHFENLEDFGKPAWADGMRKTVTIGRLTFYRPRSD